MMKSNKPKLSLRLIAFFFAKGYSYVDFHDAYVFYRRA